MPSHFGPFGVKEELRRAGLGKVLFYKMLYKMYCEGLYHAWLAWTPTEARPFYEKAGMKVCNRYPIMKKRLDVVYVARSN